MIINLYTINIFTPLQKLPKNVGDLSRLIVAKGFAKLPKVQLIAQYGHTAQVRKAADLPTVPQPLHTKSFLLGFDWEN